MIYNVKVNTSYEALTIVRKILLQATMGQKCLYIIPSNFNNNIEVIKFIVKLRTLFKIFPTDYEYFDLSLFRKCWSNNFKGSYFYVYFTFQLCSKNHLCISNGQMLNFNIERQNKLQERYDNIYLITY